MVNCSTPGTTIATPKGEVAVEKLKSGDRVFTRDNSIQQVAWVGSRTVSARELSLTPTFQPVLVRAGALGPNLPETDLLISPSHRVLMSGPQAMLHFEENEVLVAAKHLTGIAGIDIVTSVSPVTYVHFMFARHEIILANGCWTESFQPDDHTLSGIGNAQRNEIITLFPKLAENETVRAYGRARKVFRKHEAVLPKR